MVTCPKCDSPAVNPDTGKLLIRIDKVALDDGRWWSHCLVCSGYYMPDKKTFNPVNVNKQGFWLESYDQGRSFWFTEDGETARG